MTALTDYLNDHDRRLAARFAVMPMQARATAAGRAQARRLAEHGPWVRAAESAEAAEYAADDAVEALLDEVRDAVVALTGRGAPLTALQETSVLTPNLQPGLDPEEQLVDAVLGAEDLPVDLVHPRWRHITR